jgi:DNA-binding LytR/AlgR family response regulator
MMNDELMALVRDTLRNGKVAAVLERMPELRALIQKMVRELNEQDEFGDDDTGEFIVNAGAEFIRIQTRGILFLESRAKRMVVHTRGQELEFYANFNTCMTLLPQHFVRCHKSFVVNLRKVRSANFSENTLTLVDNGIIPISRTYRDGIRAWFAGKECVV